MLAPGESLHLDRYTLTYESLRQYAIEGGDRQVTEAKVNLFQDGRLVMALKPHKDFFLSTQQPLSIPAVLSRPGEDVYILLVGWEEASSGGATFKIYLNPLVNWVWLGGLALIIGTLFAAWPERQAAASWTTTRQPVLGVPAK